MDCNKAKDQLLDYLYEEMDERSRKDFQAHLDTCPNCRQELEKLGEVQAAFSELPIAVPSMEISDKILDSAGARPLPFWKRWAAGFNVNRFIFHPATAAAMLMVIVLGVGLFISEQQPAAPEAPSFGRWSRRFAEVPEEREGSQNIGDLESARDKGTAVTKAPKAAYKDEKSPVADIAERTNGKGAAGPRNPRAGGAAIGGGGFSRPAVRSGRGYYRWRHRKMRSKRARHKKKEIRRAFTWKSARDVDWNQALAKPVKSFTTSKTSRVSIIRAKRSASAAMAAPYRQGKRMDGDATKPPPSVQAEQVRSRALAAKPPSNRKLSKVRLEEVKADFYLPLHGATGRGAAITTPPPVDKSRGRSEDQGAAYRRHTVKEKGGSTATATTGLTARNGTPRGEKRRRLSQHQSTPAISTAWGFNTDRRHLAKEKVTRARKRLSTAAAEKRSRGENEKLQALATTPARKSPARMAPRPVNLVRAYSLRSRGARAFESIPRLTRFGLDTPKTADNRSGEKLKGASGSPRTLYIQASRLFKARKYDEAIAKLNLLLRHPGKAAAGDALYLLVRIEKSRGRLAEAIQLLKRYRKLYPFLNMGKYRAEMMALLKASKQRAAGSKLPRKATKKR